MATIYFPDNISNPDYPLGINWEDNSISSQAEDGTVIARKQFTRSRDTFILTWSALPKAEYDILRNFIKNVICFKANSFMWKNPEAEANGGAEDWREVRLVEVKEPKLTMLHYYSISITIQEV